MASQALLCQNKTAKNQRKEKHIVPFVLEVLKYRGDIQVYEDIKSWPIPVFPVTGKDLMAAGVQKDKKFGEVLNTCKEMWIESDFKLTKAELLAKIPEVASTR